MKRIVEIDALRGMAALMIVVTHMHGDWFRGWSRVEMFLVLSGFLITSVAQRKLTGFGDLRDLIARRALRIWPAYWMSLLLVVALNPWFNQPFGINGAPFYAVFLQNTPRYWGAAPRAIPIYFSHTWTLAVLEQFHLIWPAALLLLGRRGAALAAVALIAGTVAARSGGAHPWLLIGRADGLALGSLLALALADPDRVRAHRRRFQAGLGALIVAGAVLGLTAPDTGPVSPEIAAASASGNLGLLSCSIIYTGLIGLIALNSGHRLLAPLRHPWLVTLGTLSYGIYLLHPLAIVASGRFFQQIGLNAPFWALELLKMASCLIAAAGCHYLVERPILAWRDRAGSRDRQPQSSALAVRTT